MAIKILSAPSQKTGAGGTGETVSTISELVSFLIATNRISDRLGNALAALEPEITVTDWLLLDTLNKEGPLAAAKAAAKIGITRQRIHQQIATLTAAGFLLSAAGEEKGKTLSIAPGGKTLLQRIEQGLQKSFTGEGGEMPKGPIHTASMSTRRIVKFVTAKHEKIADNTQG